LGANGIIVGAEGFVLERPDGPALLLLHGAGDTPQTLGYAARALFARGYHVEAPLLPRHGRTPRDFAQLRADDLTDAARSHYARLAREHAWVGVVGLSMGGALAVQIAAEAPRMPALALLAPYLALPAYIERAARWSWLWGPVVPLVRSGDGMSVFDPEERDRSLAYGVFTPAALRALRETVLRAVTALPCVSAPTLVVHSRSDNRIDVKDAEAAFARLGAKEKRLEWIEGAAHIITVDYGRDRVFQMVADWMDSHRAVRS
jgi:carboxylesterase